MKHRCIKRRMQFLAVVMLASITLWGCDKLTTLLPKMKPKGKTAASVRIVKGTVVAKVNDIPITLEDLNQEIDTYNSLIPQDKPEEKITTSEQKINYLKNQLVRRALLYQEALKRGLDNNEEMTRAVEKAKMMLMVEKLVENEFSKVDVTSKEIEEYYNTFKERLKDPEERQVREIMVNTDQEARDILIQLLQGADFATIAKERSRSPSAKNGGDLGFIKKEGKFPQFLEMAFSSTLEAGNLSTVFRGPDGYYIMKIEAKRGGKQKSLADLWDDIKRGLLFLKQQQKIEDLVSTLAREEKIELYEGEVK